MKTVAPDYYRDFHCKAGNCKHTCCAGWEIVLDEDDALDAMLEPGTSLLYAVSGRVLQAHVGEDGVLSCLILRDAMPERLY